MAGLAEISNWPTPINADKISAKIDQGLVTLILHKAEHVKPRKISVS